jgi:hypothetical protein
VYVWRSQKPRHRLTDVKEVSIHLTGFYSGDITRDPREAKREGKKWAKRRRRETRNEERRPTSVRPGIAIGGKRRGFLFLMGPMILYAV